jgi:coiled-coil domain-containing protein 130
VTDPLAALEKVAVAQNHHNEVQVPRLESLQSSSHHFNSDPYSLSLKVRKRFREDKKVEKQRMNADDRIRGRYALPESLALVADDAAMTEDARKMWNEERSKRKLEEKLPGVPKRRKLGMDLAAIASFRRSSSSTVLRKPAR